jgi:hypothetical protein
LIQDLSMHLWFFHWIPDQVRDDGLKIRSDGSAACALRSHRKQTSE